MTTTYPKELQKLIKEYSNKYAHVKSPNQIVADINAIKSRYWAGPGRKQRIKAEIALVKSWVGSWSRAELIVMGKLD